MSLPAEFATWYEGVAAHLSRAAADVLDNVHRFIEDWGPSDGFRCEREPIGRIKSAERTYSKCLERGITEDFDRLLADPYEVGDLVGVRFVVRSRADVELVLAALERQGTLNYLAIDDFRDSPRPSGYRAVHINGVVEVKVRDISRAIPFEVQIKTLAQDSWGYFTHDTAYVPTEANQHPRFAHVKELQRLLADLLHNVDVLEQQIEVQAEQIAGEVAAQGNANEVMFATVRRAMEEAYEIKLSVSEAQR